MFDQKRINQVVNKLASRGGASDFSARMAAGKRSAAANRANSTAKPSAPPKAKVVSGKTLNAVKPPATKLPAPARGGGGPTDHETHGTGPIINFHFHGKK